MQSKTVSSLPSAMKLLEVASLDGPQAMKLVERPVPRPNPDQVLVKVMAAGVNFGDVMSARGTPPIYPETPFIAGAEFCGEVVATGGENPPYPLGSRVIGLTSGAFAEYVTVPSAALMPLPESWSFTQGAAYFAASTTAYACIRTFGGIAEGESVLIHAAAGGVGQVAIRLARHFGARVFATASTPEKLEIARRLGADELIDYVEEDFVAEIRERTNGRGVDLVLEMVGGETFGKSLEAVVPFGRVVVFGNASGKKAAIDNVGLFYPHAVNLIGYNMGDLMQRPDMMGPMLAEIDALVELGVLRPDEPEAHPLSSGPDVLSAMEKRETAGKHVLIP